jgi:hypothetical protein
VSEKLISISSSIKLFILILIILDLVCFYYYYLDTSKALGFSFIIFMQIPTILILVIFNFDTKYEKSIFDKIHNLINFFFKDPLLFIFFISLFCIVSLIIRIPILDFLQVNPLNIVVIIPIFIGSLFPFLIVIYICMIYITFQEFSYNNLLNFLINSINMKNIKYLIIVITFLCLCKFIIIIFFFDITLDFSAITESISSKLNMNINKLLNPVHPNIGNNNGPQVPAPDPSSNYVPEPAPGNASPIDPSIGIQETTHVSTEQFAGFLGQERDVFLNSQKPGPYKTAMEPKMKELSYDFRRYAGSSIYNKAAISMRRTHPELFSDNPGLTVVNEGFITSIRNLNYDIPITNLYYDAFNTN